MRRFATFLRTSRNQEMCSIISRLFDTRMWADAGFCVTVPGRMAACVGRYNINALRLQPLNFPHYTDCVSQHSCIVLDQNRVCAVVSGELHGLALAGAVERPAALIAVNFGGYIHVFTPCLLT